MVRRPSLPITIILVALVCAGCAEPRKQEARNQVQVLRSAVDSSRQAERDFQRRLVQLVMEREKACQQERWRAAVLDLRVQTLQRIDHRRQELHRLVEVHLDTVAMPELEQMQKRLTAAQQQAGRGDAGAVREADNLKAAMAASLALVKKHQVELGAHVDARLAALRAECMAQLDQKRDAVPAVITAMDPEATALAIVPRDAGRDDQAWKGVHQGFDALDRYLQSPTGFALFVDGLMPDNAVFNRWRRQVDDAVTGLQDKVGAQLAGQLGGLLDQVSARLTAVTLPGSTASNRKDD